jgi:preprotein translocase subunit SecY
MASILYKLEPLYRHFPEVRAPEKYVSLKNKLIWVGVVLVLFLAMGTIEPIGATRADASNLGVMQIVFASQLGTLMSVGIGPIVTASIILQLLVGAKMINLDLHKPEDRAVFQGTMKLLTILVALFEAYAFTSIGAIPLTTPGDMGLIIFVTLQIAGASVLLMFLDEIVSKWGIGSGVGLFIAAGVAQQIVNGMFSFVPNQTGGYFGILPNFFSQLSSGILSLDSIALLWPMFMTIVVFIMVAYLESLKIEIPLSYGRFGIGARYPLKFFYTSNIPVILASAVLANVVIFAGIFQGAGMPILGQVQDGQIIPNLEQGGIGYLITSNELGAGKGILSPDGIVKFSQPAVILHFFVYLLVFLFLCVLFGVFWVMMSSMDPETVASQMESSGLQIPGFRADKRVIQKVLERYIPQLTVISAIFVGLLAVFADLTGALGTGTGILLTVGILYRMYEDIKKEQLNEVSPALRKFMGQ